MSQQILGHIPYQISNFSTKTGTENFERVKKKMVITLGR